MESRKKRNKEIERKRKQQQKIFTWILASGIVLAVVVLGYAIWDIQNRRTIMTFEGEKIATTDFRFFHALTQEGDDRNDLAMNDLKLSLVLLNKAKQNNIEPTSEEMTELLSYAREYKEYMSGIPGGFNFITDRRVADLSSVVPGQSVFERLMELYIPNFEHDEDEMEIYIEENMDYLMNSATNTYYKYIISSSYEDINSAYVAVMIGEEDFDDLIRLYDSTYVEGAEIERHDLWDLFDMDEATVRVIDATQENYEMLTELPEGGVSDIMQNINGTYVIAQKTESVVDHDVLHEEIEQTRIQFIEGKRYQAFGELINEWVENANFSINQRALDRF